MRIAVTGLWHLGLVTSACLANTGYEVVAYDQDKKLIADLNNAKTPIMEPGFDDMLSASVANNKLTYSSDLEQLKNKEIVWVTYDTPVNDEDEADVQYVTNQVKSFFPHLANNTIVILSSQLPVGTGRILQQSYQETIQTTLLLFQFLKIYGLAMPFVFLLSQIESLLAYKNNKIKQLSKNYCRLFQTISFG